MPPSIVKVHQFFLVKGLGPLMLIPPETIYKACDCCEGGCGEVMSDLFLFYKLHFQLFLASPLGDFARYDAFE
jgi:hypothetical protein